MLWIVVVLLIVAAAGIALRRQIQSGDRVRLQLSGPPQAEFAGYYAAQARGFYREAGLDVQLLPGESSASSLKAIAGGQADVAVSTVPALLAARSRGLPLVNIAQIFQYSGLRIVALKEAGIRGPTDLRGRKVGVWLDGRELALLALLEKYHISRGQLSLISQPPTMQFLISRQVDAAMTTTYREMTELRGVEGGLEALVVIDLNREGTAMLEDGLVGREDWIHDPQRLDLIVRFLHATLHGWEFCRERPDECGEILTRVNRDLDKTVQTDMVHAVNRLIWGPTPPKAPPGFMDPDAFARTVKLLVGLGAIKPETAQNAYTHKVWTAASKLK